MPSGNLLKSKTRMAACCITAISQGPYRVDAGVGFKYGRDAEKYDKRFCQFEHLVEQLWSTDEEEDISEEEIEVSISILASLLAELECLSLIFKRWLRRINGGHC